MKKIENYETIQANTGDFARPSANGYICRIAYVEDVPMDEVTNKGDYLRIEYDIADGEFKGYYKEQFVKWGGKWNATFIRSYKEKALGMFKHFTNCVEQSNAGYEWDWNEKGLVGKLVGLVLGEEDYKNSTGDIKTKLVVSQIKTVEEIKNGDFKVPAPKKLQPETTSNDFDTFEEIKTDNSLPF